MNLRFATCRFKLSNGGFTLVELIVTVSVVAILAVIGVANYVGLRNREVLESQIDEIVADMRWTAARSRAQEGGNQWGIRFTNPAGDNNDFYEIWSGTSYTSGTVYKRVSLPSGLRFTDPAASSTKDTIFSKATGLPTATSTIVVQSVSTGGSGTISLDAQGQVDYTMSN